MRKFLLLAAAVAATGLVAVRRRRRGHGSWPSIRSSSAAPQDCKGLGVTSAVQAKFDQPADGATDGRVHSPGRVVERRRLVRPQQ